jgi:hypothetical protein
MKIRISSLLKWRIIKVLKNLAISAVQFVIVLFIVVQMIERSGDGPLKRQEAIDRLREYLDTECAADLPRAFHRSLQGPLLGWLVDTAVWFCNKHEIWPDCIDLEIRERPE